MGRSWTKMIFGEYESHHETCPTQRQEGRAVPSSSGGRWPSSTAIPLPRFRFGDIPSPCPLAGLRALPPTSRRGRILLVWQSGRVEARHATETSLTHWQSVLGLQWEHSRPQALNGKDGS